MKDVFFMRAAIAAMKRGMVGDQSPFGAAIVKNKKIIATAFNTVLRTGDPTAHAEVNVIRKAAKKLRNFSGATIYSTCEPCPMCFSAIHWARIPRLVFGAKIADAKKLGFRELPVSVFMLRKLGEAKIRISQVGRAEALIAMSRWHGKTY